VIRAETEDEALAQAAAHAQQVQNLQESTPKIEEAVRAAIRDE
jgi:predicted small metal-binding protein